MNPPSSHRPGRPGGNHPSRPPRPRASGGPAGAPGTPPGATPPGTVALWQQLTAVAGALQAIRSGQKTPLFMLGLTMALLAHIPVVGLLVPALAALSFVHYGLEALRRSRGGALVTIEGERL